MNGAWSSARCASGHVLRFGALVDEHAVALAERAAARVLAGEAHRRAFEQQRAERERLGERPVDLVARRTSCAGSQELALELRVRPRSARATSVSAVDDLRRARRGGTAGVDRRRRRELVGRARRRPASVGVGRRRAAGVRLVERVVEPGAEVVSSGLLASSSVRSPRLHEQLGVELAHRAALVDELVHARLRERGLVGFVVPVAPVADHVDDDVLLERAAGTRTRAGSRAPRPRGRRRSRGRSAPAPSWRRRWRTRSSARSSGAVVNPSWLLTTMCTVPPTS